MVKHAEASEVSVQLIEKDKILHLNIYDNGKGFIQDEVRNKSLGLKALKSTLAAVDGILDIDSVPDKGTKVQIRIPVAF